jgi:hypothetical protein
MKSTTKNIIVFSFVVISLGITIFLIKQRDNRVVNLWNRNKYTTDSIYASPDERIIAQQFSDTILPALKQKGLIVNVEQTEMHTVITVSGRMWKERSPFFKENFLTHVMIYNKVHGFSEVVTIVDERSGHVYARVIPPGRKELYE